MQNETIRDNLTPWHDVGRAAQRAHCGRKSIYVAVKSGKLRAARLNGRRDLRFLPEWIDAWLIATSQPTEMVTR